MMRLVLISLFAIFLNACESNPPAPVVDRKPQSSKAKPAITKSNTAIKTADGKDWRPDTYIVKKGDTLFSIGLENGFEYKEIAVANRINEPYTIHIGQKLNLATLKAKPETAENTQPAQNPAEDGVVLTPIGAESPVIANKSPEVKTTQPKPTLPAAPHVLSEPKALRETYSLEAFNKVAVVKMAENKAAETNKAVEAKPADNKSAESKTRDAKTTDFKTSDTKTTDAKAGDDESITWAWPAKGKVVANFNEATNKGLDIGGSSGQAIQAASSGKVIYSGSDLRGYGKLVIIKHSKTYLSVYAHNSKIIVKEGQIVALGQKIAEMGNTDSSSVKLHFEIRRLGKSVDPARYLNQN